MMLSATIPSYKSKKGNEKEEDEVEVSGVDDLANFLGINKN